MGMTFAEKIRTVSFGRVAGGTKSGQAKVDSINATEAEWDKDFDAYKRFRREGIQPRSSQGAAELEARASDVFEVERGILVEGGLSVDRVREVEAEVNSKDVGV